MITNAGVGSSPNVQAPGIPLVGCSRYLFIMFTAILHVCNPVSFVRNVRVCYAVAISMALILGLFGQGKTTDSRCSGTKFWEKYLDIKVGNSEDDTGDSCVMGGSSSNIVIVIKLRKIKWERHVARV